MPVTTTKVTVEQLSIAWSCLIVTHIRIISAYFQEINLVPADIRWDRSQFEALCRQLQMLVSTYPAEPWAQFHWRENFQMLIAQLSRKTQRYLSHLTALFEGRQLANCPFTPEFIWPVYYFLQNALALQNNTF